MIVHRYRCSVCHLETVALPAGLGTLCPGGCGERLPTECLCCTPAMKALVEPQPPPQPGISRPLWDLVLEEYTTISEVADLVRADMRRRDEMGRAKYGTPLQTGNGRDALVDAYQEALDLVVYMRQAAEETPEGADRADCWLDYTLAVKQAERIRERIRRRDASTRANAREADGHPAKPFPMCTSHDCRGIASWEVFWPGQTRLMCSWHMEHAKGIAEAMGFQLEVRSLPPERRP